MRSPARCCLFVALGFACLGAAPPPAAAWDFRTSGDAAYCRVEFARGRFDAFRCVRPRDGFSLRFTGLWGRNVRVAIARADRFRVLQGRRIPMLEFGRTWLSSDAATVSCWSGRRWLTCKHYDGLSFSLGRRTGYRIYYDAPGFRPIVTPLFRTPAGVWCGINRRTLESAVPLLLCWRPVDGAELSISHGGGTAQGTQRRDEKAIDFRPKGFRLLRRGAVFTWRCRDVQDQFAERCSSSAGLRVFVCRNANHRLTCRNRAGHGFWINAAAFATF